MITQEWMQKYAIIKEKLVCYIDLDAYFTKEKIGQAVLDILQVCFIFLLARCWFVIHLLIWK